MFQKIIKLFLMVVILGVIAVSGYLVGGGIKYYLDIRRADKAVANFQGSLEEPYKNDTYGGKTPEETWGMFLDALKKGDIDLASKYFSADRQEKENINLLKVKQEGKLNSLIIIYSQELKKEDTQYIGKDEAYYYIVRNDFGGMADSMKFYLNPYTKVWKIVSL